MQDKNLKEEALNSDNGWIAFGFRPMTWQSLHYFCLHHNWVLYADKECVDGHHIYSTMLF